MTVTERGEVEGEGATKSSVIESAEGMSAREGRAAAVLFRMARACGPWCVPVATAAAVGVMLLHGEHAARAACAAVGVIAVLVMNLWAVLVVVTGRAAAASDRLETLVGLMPVALWVADAESQVVIRANEQMAKLLRSTPAEMEGLDVALFVPEWRRGRFELVSAQLLREGHVELREVPALARDGTILWVDAFFLLVEHGGRKLAVATLTDHTERRAMEEAAMRQCQELRRSNLELSANLSRLAESEARHRALFDQAIYGVLLVDAATGLVRDANPRALQIVGGELHDLIGRPLSRLGVGKTTTLALVTHEAATQGGVSYPETLVRRLDDTVVHVDLSASLVTYDRESLVVVSLHEVSDGRQMREALERTNEELVRQRAELQGVNAQLRRVSEAKSHYLADISHEIRTPLNAINGFAELMADESYGALTEQQRGFVADIISAGQHLLQLINDVIDLAKVEAGTIQVDPQPVAMNPLVEQAIRVIKGTARNRRVSLRLVPAESQPVALADERRSKQILFNLLTNAARYAPEGSVVEVTVQEEGEWITISVRDEGIGIDEADQERIFQEFVRVGPVGDYPGGAGLGLPLSRKLAELQGGRLAVKSSLGAGSTFWFTVPVAHPPEEEPQRHETLSEIRVGNYLKPN